MSLRLERMIRIYNRLRRGPVTIEVISKWAKTAGITVSNRQLYRDLNELKGLNITKGENIVEYADEKNRKTWKLEYEEESEKISQFDLNSFFLMKNFAPNSIYEHRKSSIEKFEKLIYKNLSRNKYSHLEANELYLRRTNFYENMYGEIEHEKIEELLWALQNKRIIVISEDLLNCANLHLPENAFPLHMYPLELVFHTGRVHLSGLAVNSKQFLLFAIDETFKYHFTNEGFNRKKLMPIYNQGFDRMFGIAAPMNNRIYTIKIEYTQSLGESEYKFFLHHSQKWSRMKNGNYMVTFKCSIGRELFGYLGFMLDKIKVHQPKVLKDLFVKKAKQIAAIHEQNLELDEEVANADY